MSFKLLVEQPNYEIETIVEEVGKNAERKVFIRGPYIVQETVNKNNRLYPKEEVEKEVDRYITEMVKPGRAAGQLNHPTDAEINLKEACHLIQELKKDGENTYVGKSMILSTPMGQLVKSLLLDGVKIGASTRALGKLEENNGHQRVKDFKLVTVDLVSDPSAPGCFVNGILEAKEYMIECDGRICEIYDHLEKKLETMPKKCVDDFLKASIVEFIKSLKGV